MSTSGVGSGDASPQCVSCGGPLLTATTVEVNGWQFCSPECAQAFGFAFVGVGGDAVGELEPAD